MIDIIRCFDAIYINSKEVVFGKISDKIIFIKCGGITKESIEKIVLLIKMVIHKILILKFKRKEEKKQFSLNYSLFHILGGLKSEIFFI